VLPRDMSKVVQKRKPRSFHCHLCYIDYVYFVVRILSQSRSAFVSFKLTCGQNDSSFTWKKIRSGRNKRKSCNLQWFRGWLHAFFILNGTTLYKLHYFDFFCTLVAWQVVQHLEFLMFYSLFYSKSERSRRKRWTWGFINCPKSPSEMMEMSARDIQSSIYKLSLKI